MRKKTFLGYQFTGELPDEVTSVEGFYEITYKGEKIKIPSNYVKMQFQDLSEGMKRFDLSEYTYFRVDKRHSYNYN